MAVTRNRSTYFAVVLIAFSLVVVGFCFFFTWVDSLWSGVPGWDWVEPTRIKSINWDETSSQIIVLVEYTGNETVTLQEVYVNGTLDAKAVIANRVLSQNQTTEIVLSETYFTKPMTITVNIDTSDELDPIMTKTFYAIGLKQVDWDEKTCKISVVVINYGDETVTLNQIYVNGILDVLALPNPKTLLSGQEAELILSGTFVDTHTSIPIKVMTLEGAADERSNPIHGLWIQSINWNANTGKINAYVYSNGIKGIGDGKVNRVYVNGTLDSSATIFTHRTGGVWTITLSKTYPTNPQQLTLKVVTSDGVFDELTMRPPNKFWD